LHDVLPSCQESQRNLLLAGLSSEALALLQKHFSEQQLAAGAMLWQAGASARWVFFPVSGMISVTVPTDDGPRVEVAIIGRESAAGFFDESGMLPITTQGVTHSSGRFLRTPPHVFAETARQSAEIGHAAALCTSWLLLQSQQIAACNAVHSANARFCCRLLRASDALADKSIPLTQEMLAQALGIRRTTATLIAQRLQMQGLITYSRGKIVIRARARLEAAACNCHNAFRRAHWPSELLHRW
jgi:CRP-like cAMP-binding protein